MNSTPRSALSWGQEALDEAVRLIGRNVTGVRGNAANLDDLDRLFDTVRRNVKAA